VYVTLRVQLLGTPLQLTEPNDPNDPFAGPVTIVNVSASPSGSVPAIVITFAVSSFVVTPLWLVAVGARFGMLIEHAAVAVCCIGDVVSTTFAVKLYNPFVVGVPAISPVPGVIVNPGGSGPDPAFSEYVYAAVPPDAASDDEYGVPISPEFADWHASVNSVAKFAVTLTGPVIVTVVAALNGAAAGPVHPLNANPAFAVAEMFCTDPAA
jgi:hypothetical protein